MENQLQIIKKEIQLNIHKQITFFQNIEKATEKFKNYLDIFEHRKKIKSLITIKKEMGGGYIRAHIELYLHDLRKFLNIKNNFDDEQILKTADFILSEYWMLNLADITLFFKYVKLGRYGNLYGRLDGQVILSWLDVYFNERCEAASLDSEKESSIYKSNHYSRQNDNEESIFKNADYIRNKHEYEFNKLQFKKPEEV